jgi:hypothetical protein
VNRFIAAANDLGQPAAADAKEAVMLITFLVAILALVIAVVACAVLNPDYRGDLADRLDEAPEEWEASI